MAAAVLIVVTGMVARILGAPDELLFRIGVLQLLSLAIMLPISLISVLALGLSAAFEKEWWRAAACLGLPTIPLGSMFLVALTNHSGFGAAMSV